MDFTKSSLHTLPVEILCYLFSFLRAPSILSCTSTCRYLRKVLDDSSALQYAIELEAQNMVAVTAPDAMSSPAERLEILRNKMCSWRAFRPAVVHQFTQPGGEISMSFGCLSTWDDHPQIAQIRALDSGPSESQFYRRWDADGYPMPKDTPFRVQSVIMDPSQDLFAFVVLEPNHMAEIPSRIYLETISTSEPHPLAASEILTSFKPHISANCHHDLTKIQLKIWGNRIALLTLCDELSPCPTRMQIWNWQEKQDFKVQQIHIQGTFLRHSQFVTINPDVQSSVATQDTRFCPNAENQLIALNVDGPPSLVFVIDTDKLLTTGRSGVHIEGQARVLSWDEWGPNCSRCIMDPIPNSLYVVRLEVAGYRAVHATPDDINCTSYSLHMYDFNKYRISRAAASKDFRGRIVTGPSAVKHDRLNKDIVTSLPYMVVIDERHIETPSNMIDVTFDDERILIIKACKSPLFEYATLRYYTELGSG
ncbi:uncharacterized protein EDB91DRAFT_1054140 [Suillus paluster]|uniref:uncharacterized protein n=1 Tax=Suillus paluster TaxID=48578 RepID=UPI001B8845B1|nr:uncharacterized protein EDB91DRAFT_1054140 [Suillus paluster]KAG1739157.1 hypothetical protein EDB91DRAFT_1054140 [Suillus paluster]